MTITNQDVKVYRRDTAQLNVTLRTADGSLYAPTINAQIKYRIARNSHTPEADSLVSKSLNNGLTVLNSIATIELSEADTDLEPGLYHHELKIVDGLDRSTAMTGIVKIKQSLDMDTNIPLQAANFSNSGPTIP